MDWVQGKYDCATIWVENLAVGKFDFASSNFKAHRHIKCHFHQTYLPLTELKITGHWPFSDQFLYLAEQNPIGRTNLLYVSNG